MPDQQDCRCETCRLRADLRELRRVMRAMAKDCNAWADDAHASESTTRGRLYSLARSLAHRASRRSVS